MPTGLRFAVASADGSPGVEHTPLVSCGPIIDEVPALSGFKQLTSQAGWYPLTSPVMMVAFVVRKASREKRSTLSSVTDVLMGVRYTLKMSRYFGWCCLAAHRMRRLAQHSVVLS